MSVKNDLGVYDRWASRWWDGSDRQLRALHQLVPARFRIFDTIIDVWRDQRVLDLGCGGGFMSEALVARGARVVGVDPSGPAIAAARAHAATRANPEYRVGFAEAIPADDGVFDVVVCVDVLEHVRDVDATLRECARVLRPGGILLFDTINRTRLSWWIAIVIAEEVLRLAPRGVHDWHKFIRPEEMTAALLRADFVSGPLVGLGPVGVTRRLDPVFGPIRPIAVQYAGSATKP